MRAETMQAGRADESMQWFRTWHEMVEDLKLKRLPPAQRWVWIAVLTIASKSPERGRLLIAEGEPATIEDVLITAAVDRADVEAAMAAFERQGMIHRAGEVWVVTHWEDRQPTSDNAAIRKRAQRERERGARGGGPDGGGGVTGQSRAGHTSDADAETETDAAANAAAPAADNVIPFATDVERKIVGYIRAVPGMEHVSDRDVLLHYRERRDSEGFSDGEALREAVKFRDWHTGRRAGARGPFRNWKNAVTNWFQAGKVSGSKGANDGNGQYRGGGAGRGAADRAAAGAGAGVGRLGAQQLAGRIRVRQRS